MGYAVNADIGMEAYIMPPVSEKQRKLFRWAAANPKQASKEGIKPSVAKEFNSADKGGKLPDKIKVSRGKRWYGKDKE